MPISTRMANVMKITYKTKNTPPIDFLSLNFAMNKVSQSKDVATRREPTTKSMPTELILTAVSEPSTSNMSVLMSQGRPKANSMAKELAPNAFDTPIPPSPLLDMMNIEHASGRQPPKARKVMPITDSGMKNVWPKTVILQDTKYELTPIQTIHITKDRG